MKLAAMTRCATAAAFFWGNCSILDYFLSCRPLASGAKSLSE